MKRIAPLLLIAVACGRPLIQNEVTIELRGQQATVTAETTFDPNLRETTARDAALANTDQWAARFARLTPDSEQVTFHRTRGVLDRVARSGRIPRDDLQRFFADASLTLNIVETNDFTELTIYPGTSTRATREQRDRFHESLGTWSREVAQYFSAVSRLYQYLDAAPGRARYVFAYLLDEKNVDGAPPAVTEDEEPLVEAVTNAMEVIARRMDVEEGRATSFAEEADLVFNPIPARLVIKVDGAIEHVIGFTRRDDAVVIEPIDLFATIASLEGQWVSPDPLSALLTEDQNVPTAEQFARLPRKWSPFVAGSEIEKALREKLERPETYVVRWR